MNDIRLFSMCFSILSFLRKPFSRRSADVVTLLAKRTTAIWVVELIHSELRYDFASTQRVMVGYGC